MPSKKSYKKKRRYSTKRVVRRKLRKFSKVGLTVQKHRPEPITFVTDAGGTFNERGCLTNPTRCFNGSNAVVDWLLVQGLWDSYRVCGIKIKYVPHTPSAQQVLPTTAQYFQPLYGIIDYNNLDSSSPFSGLNEIVQYERMKVFNLNKPWKWWIRVPKYTGATTSSVGVGVITQNRGFFNTATSELPAVGCWYLYGENLNASTTYGTLVITYYLALKNRR